CIHPSCRTLRVTCERPATWGARNQLSVRGWHRRAAPRDPGRAESAVAVLAQQTPADDRLLDLRRALADQQERRFPHQPLDLVLLGVAVAAVDAERLLSDLGAVLRRQQFGHAGFHVVALAGVLQPEIGRA